MLLFFVFALGVHCLGQGSTKTSISEGIKTDVGSDCKDWEEINLKTVTFCLPKEIKQVKVRCIDTPCFSFRSENSELDIEISDSTTWDSYGRQLPSFTYKYITVEGVSLAAMWFYEKEQYGYKYVYGARFLIDKSTNYAAAMILRFKDIKDKDTAERIFTSVRLKPKVENKDRK